MSSTEEQKPEQTSNPEEQQTSPLKQVDSLASFQLDLALINIIRDFSHKEHQFRDGFVEEVYFLLNKFVEADKAKKFEEYSQKNSGLSFKEAVLAVHFDFAALSNLQDLTKELNDQTDIKPLNSKSMNNTNILSIHSIFDLEQKLNQEKLQQVSQKISPQYLPNLTVKITAEEIELQEEKLHKNEIFLNYGLIRVQIGSKGKLDLYSSSYIATKLNAKFGTHLHHVLFQFLQLEADREKKLQKIQSYTGNYGNQFIEIGQACLKLRFDKEIYHQYRDKLVDLRISSKMSQENYERMKKELDKLISEILNFVQNFIVCRNKVQQHYIEKLLIGMLGHPYRQIRDFAVVALNVLYDGIDWQLKMESTVKVSNVGRKFQIHYLVESQDDSDIFIQVKSNIFIPECQQSISTIHKPKIREFKVVNGRRFVHVSMDLGRFTRCGFYDWRIVRLQEKNINSVYKFIKKESADVDLSSQEIKGRYIVHPIITRDLQIHEVFVDLQDGKQDDRTGELTKRGNFKTVTDALPEYKQRGVNCLYLLGALERDNGFQHTKHQEAALYKPQRPDASPLAITCRDEPNQMLGGKEGFKELTRKAKELDMHIMVDCLTRVSSSRMHKKYKKHLISAEDEQGKLVNVFGTDGRAVHYEDTTLLNYRKKKCWDLFLEEIITFANKFKISGLHLDNGQSWPQILKLDEEEMYRKEVNGEEAYTSKEIFEGKVVQYNENDSGYWGSSAKDNMPNPFLIKLCRTVWQHYPQFLVLSEVWGKMGGFEEAREFSVIQSGPIPRLFKFPLAISQFFGKNLKKDGSIHNLKEPKNVSYFKKWYQNVLGSLPEGSHIVQSTTYHTFPYPALLYKQGTWAAIDLHFFLPDIPMTFIGEKEGKATKVKATNFFQTLKVKKDEAVLDESFAENENDSSGFNSPKSQSSLFGSQVFSNTQQSESSIAKKSYARVDSAFFNKDQENSGQGHVRQGRRSSSYVQLTDIGHQNYDELQVVSQEGWGFIESLKGIKYHYEHRRNLRQNKRALKRGTFVPLNCELEFDSSSYHSHVLSFARQTKSQVAIIAINFNDGDVVGKLNFENLFKYFPDHENSGVVVEVEDWIDPSKTEKYNCYFISEILNKRFLVNIHRFSSFVMGLQVHENDERMKQRAEEHSYQRFLANMQAEVPQEIDTNEVGLRLYKLVQKCNKLQDFVNGFSYLYHKFYKGVSLNNMISLTKAFKDDNIAKNKLFSFFTSFLEKMDHMHDIKEKIDFYKVIRELIDGNNLGPICIATPEYGKYTKTGGLGVMTDELSRGLADLGETVYVITPLYEDKRKKNPSVFENDGIRWQKNQEFVVGGDKYEVGIWYGYVKGVHVYFLHNPFLFPEAFCGDDAAYIMRQLVLYAKCCLQVLCDIQVIPSIMVTNDWFSGIIPAYMKANKYGDIFDGTKIFHIAHNLDESYEGRIYPKPDDDYLQWIHEDLQFDWLVDPLWQKTIINPSRCAFMTCDNWGTVSHSYKYELLSKSALRFILGSKINAFSFPNGLNKRERLQHIIDATGNDHLSAKTRLQQKYFGFNGLDNKIPLFGFVGRITEQKGVHLILDGIHQLIQECNYKVQVIVGGMANDKEPYAKECAVQIRKLRKQYPHNFWGDPDLFFRDGPLLNCGADFGLMPSKFEPGGIVQHEFFVASTPVVATKTGGLQDTVYEYDPQAKKGTGFVFSEHNWYQMVQAMKRAIKVYKKPEDYAQLRKNAFDGTIDVSDVSNAYAMEFYRMFNKNFLDRNLMCKLQQETDNHLDFKDFQPVNMIKKKQGSVYKKLNQTWGHFEKIVAQTDTTQSKLIQFKFKPLKGTFPRQVQIIGSFDDWSKTYDLKYDQFSREWKTNLQLKIGEYHYKYKVDEQWLINPDEPQDQDQYLNVNNIIRYEQFLDSSDDKHRKQSTN